MRESKSSTAKVAIITALITAGTTILTAFIAIVPQMRQGDRTTIDQLSKETQELKTEVQTLRSARGSYRIRGQVKTKDNAPFKDAVLYAASADDSAPLDDNGKFLFENMSRKPYVVVLASQTGTVHRLLINPEDPTTDSADLLVTYAFSAE
ncbi:MAG TPA: hypothetical protein VF146_14810 [Bryobacteraceae bacterium]